MREFTEPFPETGFYVVTAVFRTENLVLIPGEVVGLGRWGTSAYVKITKTGERFNGYSNYMELEHMPKLRRMTDDEVMRTVDHFPVDCSQLHDYGYLVIVGKHIDRFLESVRR